MPLLSDRTKVTRGVLSFLALCAVLGFVTGLRGALPSAVYEEEGPVAATPSGVVVEAAPAIEPPLPAEEEEATEEEKAAEEEKAEADDAPAPTPQPKAETPASTPAPTEEAPPADPVGELIEQQPASTPPPPTTLY